MNIVKRYSSVTFILYILLISSFFSCRNESKNLENYPADKLFTLLPANYTGIDFSNDLKYNERFNPYTFHYFYNGGGVAVGDINNDGLQDLFFCSNEGPDKLYLNKGNFQFEDITQKAGIFTTGLWSTGVTFADVNGDGLLDIYVCSFGDFTIGWRGNQLFINNGNLTFTERAEEYGLRNEGLSTHAVFFDYDNDGDLDCYLLNNSGRPIGMNDLVKDQRKIVDPQGNKLYRNDGNHFTDVTVQAGIFSSKIGFGLGVTIADINKDGWPDIYVSNDFFERDYLYLNNHDGSFHESLEKYIKEISKFSMGADIADINNDGYPDIYVTDMLPQEEARIKTKTQFENWDTYQSNLKNGYYQQFLRNTLQLNRGPLYNKKQEPEFYFSEIGRLADVYATDWSWGSLIADLDNDGNKDIFVANGIYKDVTDQDFMQFQADVMKRSKTIKGLIDLLPSYPIAKYVFSNNGDLTFTNKADEWGLGDRGFSNGAVYVDLDNDGDLDLVTNNVNMPASVYRNNSMQLHPENKFLKVILQGEAKNKFGVGTKATVYYNHGLSYQEAIPARGFQSCVDNRMNFGLGKTQKIDSLKIEWPGGKEKLITNLPPNQTLTVRQNESYFPQKKNIPIHRKPIFTEIGDHGIDFVHKESDFTDFYREKLIFQMPCAEGPHMARADVNADGLDDIYVCGAKDQPGALYVQLSTGRFIKTNQKLFEKDNGSEDTDCLFFDADGDGDADLFVCSGGSKFLATAPELYSRLYLNDGKGNFTRSPQLLPSPAQHGSSSCVSAADFDGDGDLDLFIGTRMLPDQYGYPAKSFILQNNGKGIFTDVTSTVAPELIQSGMVTDGSWIDYDRDGRPDLVLCGEYLPIRIFHNEGGNLKEITRQAGLDKSNGWWNRLLVCDINGDGYPDIVAGNLGLNSRFRASEKKPVSMYVSDFDNNGVTEQVVCTYNGDKQYPLALRHDLVASLPYLKKKFLKYADYKEKTVNDIFSPEQLNKALKLDAYEMRTVVLINNGKGGFIMKALPQEAQFSPCFAMSVSDFDGDGKPDILLGGNFYQSKPETGIYDAGYGCLLKGDGLGNFQSMAMSESNFCIQGAIRDLRILQSGEKKLLIIARNNGKTSVLTY